MNAALDDVYTLFVVTVIIALVLVMLWHFYRAWLRRRDARQWNEGYHSGVLAGRRQERGETAVEEHPFSAVVNFYNSLDKGTSREPGREARDA